MITLCKHNPFRNEIFVILEEKKISYSIEKCLYRCNVCHMKPVVKKDDLAISADTVEELIKKLKLE